jgi:hypothetical protein
VLRNVNKSPPDAILISRHTPPHPPTHPRLPGVMSFKKMSFGRKRYSGKKTLESLSAEAPIIIMKGARVDDDRGSLLGDRSMRYLVRLRRSWNCAWEGDGPGEALIQCPPWQGSHLVGRALNTQITQVREPSRGQVTTHNVNSIDGLKDKGPGHRQRASDSFQLLSVRVPEFDCPTPGRTHTGRHYFPEGSYPRLGSVAHRRPSTPPTPSPSLPLPSPPPPPPHPELGQSPRDRGEGAARFPDPLAPVLAPTRRPGHEPRTGAANPHFLISPAFPRRPVISARGRGRKRRAPSVRRNYRALDPVFFFLFFSFLFLFCFFSVSFLFLFCFFFVSFLFLFFSFFFYANPTPIAGQRHPTTTIFRPCATPRPTPSSQTTRKLRANSSRS